MGRVEEDQGGHGCSPQLGNQHLQDGDNVGHDKTGGAVNEAAQQVGPLCNSRGALSDT